MDYFLIELVNTVRASSAVAVARTKKIEHEMIDAGLLSAPPPTTAAVNNRDSLASTTSKPDAKAPVDEEEEAVRLRLESIGMHVGANVAERCVICACISMSLTRQLTGYATIALCSLILSTRLNSFARTSGLRAGISKWTTCAQIIAYAVCTAIPLSTEASGVFRVYTSFRTTLSNPSREYPAGREGPTRSRKQRLYVLRSVCSDRPRLTAIYISTLRCLPGLSRVLYPD